MDILKDKSSRKFIPEIDEVLTEKWYSPSCWYKVLHPEDKQRVQEVPQESVVDMVAEALWQSHVVNSCWYEKLSLE